ncbi:MAG: AraC family transcriptional regulator [Flavobacteriaceae bacterium]
MLEAINFNVNSSFKVASYNAATNCESTGWHIHPEFELVYVKNGSGCLHVGSKKSDYTNGALIFLGGNIPHADFGNKDSMEIVVQFKKEFLEEKLSVFPEFKGIKQLIEKSNQVLIFDQKTKIESWNYFKKFETLDIQGRLINLLSILDYLSKNGSYEHLFDTISLNGFKKIEISRLEKTFEYINKNYHKNISVGEISNRLGYTPNSFCRFFKKLTGQRFISFVNEFRVGRAAEYFNENNTAIIEVMYKSGFNDPSYFARQFKKYQGVSPTGYLKQRYP